MSDQEKWERILLLIIENPNSSVSDIRRKAGIHNAEFTTIKNEMAKKSLIAIEVVGLREKQKVDLREKQKVMGRTQLLSVTSKGMNWLASSHYSSLQKILRNLAFTIGQMRSTEDKKFFREKLSGIAGGEDFERNKQDAESVFQPFNELLRNILVLQLWLQPNNNHITGIRSHLQLLKSENPPEELTREEAESIVDNNWFLFLPKMIGFMPLPANTKESVSYYQKIPEFVDSLKPLKNGPLEPQPIRKSRNSS